MSGFLRKNAFQAIFSLVVLGILGAFLIVLLEVKSNGPDVSKLAAELKAHAQKDQMMFEELRGELAKLDEGVDDRLAEFAEQISKLEVRMTQIEDLCSDTCRSCRNN